MRRPGCVRHTYSLSALRLGAPLTEVQSTLAAYWLAHSRPAVCGSSSAVIVSQLIAATPVVDTRRRYFRAVPVVPEAAPIREVAVGKMKSLGAIASLAGLWKTSDLNTASQELPDPKLVGLSMLLMSLPKEARASLVGLLPALLMAVAAELGLPAVPVVDPSAKHAPGVALALLLFLGVGAVEEAGVQATIALHTKGGPIAKAITNGTTATVVHTQETKDLVVGLMGGSGVDRVSVHWQRVVSPTSASPPTTPAAVSKKPSTPPIAERPTIPPSGAAPHAGPSHAVGAASPPADLLDHLPKVPAVVLWRLIEHAVPEAPRLEQVQAVYGKILGIELDVDRWVEADDATQNKVSMRQLIRKQYTRVVEVLNRCKPFGCHVSSNGTICTKARPDDIRHLSVGHLDEASGQMYADAPPVLKERVESALVFLRGAGWAGFTTEEVERLLNPPKTADEAHASSAQENSNLLAAATPGWEFEDLRTFYQPTMTREPPPPPEDAVDSAGSSFRQAHNRQAVRDGNSEFSGVFSAQMLVPLIPTFFVPVQVMVKQLPEGYTEDHVHTLFKQTGTVEIIQIGERKEHFIRLHGGNRAVDMVRVSGAGNSYYANHLPAYERFRPDPSMCDHFESVLRGVGVRAGQWVSLKQLLTEYADPEVVKALPYQRFLSLLYFAQMQHRFQFATEGGGKVCMIDPQRANLSPETSPTPVVVNEILGILLTHKEVSIDTLTATAEEGAAGELDSVMTGGEDVDLVTSLQGLSAYSRDTLLEYFDGSLLRCLQSHHQIFYIDLQKMTVCNHNHRRNQLLKSKSLEEQLQDAITHRDKVRIKKLRRKIMKQINPDNPLFDPTRLAEEISRFLPERQPISLRMLMRNLPHEVSNCFPATVMSVFRNHPKLFKVFEFKESHKLYIQRPEIPLPEGHLKMTYTEPELLHLIAGILQSSPSGSRTLYDVYGKLPYFAQETVRTVHKNIFDVVKKYPQYFTVVFKESVRMDIRVANCSLLALPPHVTIEEGAAEPGGQRRGGGRGGGNHHHRTYGATSTPADTEGDDAELQAALESLRANITKAGYKESTIGKGSDDDFDFSL